LPVPPVSAQRIPTLILFCGLPGAGKTTLARRLEAAGGSVRICTDDWQAELGVPHEDTGFHGRLQLLLDRHALTLLEHGTDVIHAVTALDE
jgi:broad-specificity NMP kinase